MGEMPVPPDIAAKLTKVLALLSSDYDGEVAAAGRRANALLKGAGLTWGDVIGPPTAPRPEPPHRPPRRWRRVVSHTDAAAQCLQWREEVLSDWEADFCKSVLGRHRISPKQSEVLERIAAKCERFARASGEWS